MRSVSVKEPRGKGKARLLNELRLFKFFRVFIPAQQLAHDAVPVKSRANAEWIGELLRTLIPDFDYEQFDRMRWVRNSINYYGKAVELGQGRELIAKMLAMKNRIKEQHLRDTAT